MSLFLYIEVTLWNFELTGVSDVWTCVEDFKKLLWISLFLLFSL